MGKEAIMFEKIHFTNNFSKLEMSSDEISRRREDLGPISSESTEGEIPNEFLNADFYISGTIRSVSPFPMTAEDQERFIYLQNFDYMVADKQYHARQRGYHSFQILFTYSGKGIMEYKGKAHELTPETVFLADCMNPRKVRTAGSSWEHSDLHFYGGISEYLYRNFFLDRSPLFHTDEPEHFQKMLETLLLYHTTVSVGHEWYVSSALEDMLRFLLNKDEKPSDEAPERIQYLVTYISNNFTRKLTMEELSDFAGLSQYHLSREFRKYTGMSPYSYITGLRIQYAQALLRQTKIPVYRIAELVGIPDEANFIRAFTKRTHMTPGEYRKQG